MRWLALHLPHLSLEALAATLPGDARAAPLALLHEHRIGAVNAAAAERGVRAGLKRATALALAPELKLGQADARREARALEAVAHVALAFTPMVAVEPGRHTVLLELQSCLRLFGGPARLRQRLHDALAPLGHRVRDAAAPTAAGAALLARWGTRAHGDLGELGDPAQAPHAADRRALQALIDAAPVHLLGPGREHWEALQGMGLHRIADLRALPRSGLVRRFGATLLDELDRARGDKPDPRDAVVLAPVFETRLELFARADTAEQLLHAAAALLARLVAWAQARHARIAAFTLRMAHEHRNRGEHPAHTDLRIELAEPAADAAHLQAVLRERLARTPLPAPTLDLHLHCRDTVQAPAPNGELFASARSRHEGLVRLLERLRARLGDAQVQVLQALPDHRPERASRSAPAGVPVTTMPAAQAVLPLHRPVWLLPEPEPLAERGALPLLAGRPLQIVAGPERIEAGWWDGEPAARDYFIAQDEAGALVWVYRARLPLARGAASGWFLQGRFG